MGGGGGEKRGNAAKFGKVPEKLDLESRVSLRSRQVCLAWRCVEVVIICTEFPLYWGEFYSPIGRT